MTLPLFFLRTALNHLRRGEQRMLAALLCITFGVMSLVAMGLVAHAISEALVVKPAELIGADLNITRNGNGPISADNLAELDGLQQAGQITRYTLLAATSTLVFHTPASGELHFVDTALGIDPAVYPLAGVLLVGDPAGGRAADLLRAPGDVLVTRDIALAAGLHVGDVLALSDLDIGAPVAGVVRGIVFDTPGHRGGRMYYSFATAEAVAGNARVMNVALALAPAPEAVAAQLDENGWFAIAAIDAAESNQDARDLNNLLLKGAGILGLLVGGIGIASTMQVLLRRRQREIAVWKTLGYSAGQLQVLFATEAALLGAAGSVMGAGLGVAVSSGLLDVLRRTGSFLLNWSFSPWPVAAGALVGLATTVIFALWAIVRAAGASPMALLRNETLPADGGRGWLRSLALAVALAVPFAAITSWVMGSVWNGVGVLLFALGGLVVLGGLLGGLAWVGVRLLGVLPASLPLVRLARGSLRQRGRGLGLVFAMIALFTGIVALALGVVVTRNGQREMDARSITVDGPEISVLAAAGEQAALTQAAKDAGLDPSALSFTTAVQSIAVQDGSDGGSISPMLLGRTLPGAYTISGAPWGSVPDGVYVFGPAGVPDGSQVVVTLWDGSTRSLPVVESYTVNFATFRFSLGLLMPAELSQRLTAPDSVQLDLDTAPSQAAALTTRLGQALPQATVVDQVAYGERFVAVYRNLFILALAMSGLALLAGALLVANTVSLAMLDRRFEIGVLKAVGYTRRHLLSALSIEYGLVAVIATGAALVGVQVLLWVLGRANPLAGRLLVLSPDMVALIGAAGVGLILLTVVMTTWTPTGVSPAIVLNDRE